MKKNYTRIISAVLAIVMVMLMIPAGALTVIAANETLITNVDNMGKLGYGFNMLGNKYLSSSSVKRQIFKSTSGFYPQFTGDSYTTTNFTYISSVDTYLKNKSHKWNANLSVNARMRLLALDIQAKFGMANSSSEFGSESNELSVIQVLSRKGKYDMQLDNSKQIARLWARDEKNQYVTFYDDFVDALLTATPAELFENYGTHIITRYSAGGEAYASYQGSNIKKNLASSETWEANASVQVSTNVVLDIKAGLDAKVNKENQETHEDVMKSMKTNVTGGDGFSLNDILSSESTVNKWLASLDRDKIEILSDDDLRLLAIWDLLVDDEYADRKVELEQYFNEHLDSEYAQFYGDYIYNPAKNTDYTDYTFIRTAEEFNDIRNNLSGKYVLLNNIDLSSYSEWAPIGETKESAFTGILDGNGNTVSGLNITKCTNGVAGLFGYNKGTVRNLNVSGIINANATGSENNVGYVGGIVGYNIGTIENCRNKVSMNGEIAITDAGDNTQSDEETVFDIYGSAIESAKNKAATTLSDNQTINVNTPVKLSGTATGITIKVSGTSAMAPAYIVLENANITGTIVSSGDRAIFIISMGESNSITGSADTVAINAPNGAVYATGDAPLTVTGGKGSDGADGATNKRGANGKDGKAAIVADNFATDIDADLFINGGSGGHGGNGGNGSNGNNGTNGACWWANGTYSTPGIKGNDGQAGGDGGSGGIPIVLNSHETSLKIYNTKVHISTGTGGNGGKGGNGGNGGKGGDGGSRTDFKDVFNWDSVKANCLKGIDASDGGNGGNGGNGGASGAGYRSNNIVNSDSCKIYGEGYILIFYGIDGNVGKGGNGGTAGSGGNPGVSAGYYLWNPNNRFRVDGRRGTAGAAGAKGELGAAKSLTSSTAFSFKSGVFDNGEVDVGTYDNKEAGVTVKAVSSSPDNPSGKPYELKIISKYGSSPWHLGGYVYSIPSSARKEFCYMILAKIPAGYSLGMYSNSIGDGSSTEWLTSNEGTGKWEWYIGKTTCGTSGKFADLGYVAINGKNEADVEWRVGYHAIYDCTSYSSKLITATGEYKLFNESMTWQEAQRFAKADGALVSIGSADEEELIEELISVSGGGDYWIGLKTLSYDEETETAICVWEDGSKIKVVGKGSDAKVYRLDKNGNEIGDGYADFYDGEPNNSGNEEIYHHFTYGSAWNDNSETKKLGYITEKKLKTETINTADKNALIVGGICGYNTGRIVSAYNNADVFAYKAVSENSGVSAYAGGIAGYNNNTIEKSFNDGKIDAFAMSNSRIGYADAYAKNITNGESAKDCYGTVNTIATAVSANALINEDPEEFYKNGNNPKAEIDRYWNNSNIEIDGITKLEYLTDSDFEKDTVSLTYNGKNLESYVVRKNFFKSGTTTVTISYDNLERYIPVNVIDAAPEVLEIYSMPETEFIVGSEFSTYGLTLKLIYNNGKEKLISSKQFIVSKPNMSQTGKQTVTVKYFIDDINYMECSYEINIYPISITAIQISNMPDKRTYLQGESLDLRGIKIQKVMNDGSVVEISTDDEALKFDYDFSVGGTATVTAKYQGHTATFDVDVIGLDSIKITKQPDKLIYRSGESLSLDGMEVTAYYSDGTERIITDYTVNAAVLEDEGEQNILIEYDGKYTYLSVYVSNEVDEDAPQLIIGKARGLAGEYVTVEFVLKNVEAVKSMMLYNFTYDSSVLELQSDSKGWTVDGALLADWNPTKMEAALLLNSNADINGVLFSLKFRILDDAALGNYAIGCSVAAKAKPENEAEQAVAIAVVNGSVEVASIARGDVNGDDTIDSDDVIYLLKYTLLPDIYPINQSGDMDGNGTVDSDDVIYLLKYTLLPDIYPLH